MNGRKEHEEKGKLEGRMPPGQSLTRRFPVLHYGRIPTYDLAAWDFHVWGEVEKELHLTWAEIIQLPKTKIVMDLHCVTTWSMLDTEWEGISVRTLLDLGLVKPLSQAKFVMQHAENGFTTNIPLEVALADNFLMASHYNGQPLTPEHGYPLRGVVGAIKERSDLKVPYLWKGAKWLRGLEFMQEDRLGFWERAGYHNEADVWKEQRRAGDY